MRKIVNLLSVIMTLLVGLSACIPVRSGRRDIPRKIEGHAGVTIPAISISIDASYDPRLDNIISGYKLLPVTLRNISLMTFPMDDKNDRWLIIGEKGKRYAAVNTLRTKDQKIWRELPEAMRSIIDYPEFVPINYSVTFDLLLPKGANLEYFRAIRYENAVLKRVFVIEKEY